MFDCLSLYISLLFFLSLCLYIYLLLSLFYFLSSTIYLLLSISYYLYSTTYLSSTTIFYYPSSAMYQSSAIFICLSLLSVTCLSTFRAHITLSIEPRGPSVSKSHSGFECFVSSVETLRRTDVNDVSTLTKMSIATHHNIAGGRRLILKDKVKN